MNKLWLRFLLLPLPLLLGASFCEAQPAQETVLLMAQLRWPGVDLTQAQIRVFRDAQHKEAVGVFPSLDASGKVVLTLPAGTYYLMAVADVNGNQKMDAGDGLGFYGVLDPTTSQPQPLELKQDTAAISIAISLKLNEEGKLEPTGVKEPEAPKPPALVSLAGQVSGLGPTGVALLYLVSKEGRCLSQATVIGTDGHFNVSAIPAGTWYIFAVQDANDNEQVDAGDLIAVLGYTAEMARTFPTCEVTESQPELKLEMTWKLTETGLLKALVGEAEGPQMDVQTLPGAIYGRITNTPDPTPRMIVRGFADDKLTEAVGEVAVTTSGYALAVRPGICYLSVTADVNADGQTGPGDLLGFSGVKSLMRSHGPEPISARAGEIRQVDLLLVACLDDNRQPLAWPPPAEVAAPQMKETNP